MAKKKLLEEIDDELKERIESKISWEGLDYYLDEGGWAEEDFKDTVLEPLLVTYLEAKRELVSVLSDMGIEV